MKIFELTWGWGEDFSLYLFAHTDKTEQQFKRDVRLLLVKYGKDYLASEETWAGAHKWIDFIATKMPEFGYEPVEPIRENFYGSSIIDNDYDGKAWGEVVGDELLQQAVLHNIEQEQKMRKHNL